MTASAAAASRRRRPAALFAAGLAALATAWVFSNPLGAAPDEFANNVKAVASGRGQWLGRPVTAVQPALSPRAHAWYLRASREFRLPASALMPAELGCVAFRPDAAATCQRVTVAATRGSRWAETPQGTYPPFVYAAVGAAASVATGFRAVAYAIRLSGAALCALLWGAAAWLCASGPAPRLRLLGLAAAVTPMALFLASAQGTAGVEVAAAVCLWAALLAVTRAEPPRGAWAAVGVGGAALALSRQVDPLFVAVAVALVALFRGRDGVTAALRRGGRAAAVAGGAVVLACLLMVGWDLGVMPHPLSPRGVVASALHDLLHGAGSQLLQTVGIFGWLDTRLPAGAYAVWAAVGLALVVAAARSGRRPVLVIAATVVTVAGLDVLLAVLVIAPNGFAMQVRYVLALAVGVPLLAGEAAARAGGGRLARRAAVLGVGALAAVQALAVYVNEHRYAVGARGPLAFVGRGWRPPGGQLAWLLLAVCGAAGLLAGVLTASAPEPGTPPPRPATPGRAAR